MRQFLSALQSVLAAFFGVQSEHKREADFSQHSPVTLIIIAIIILLVLIFSIYIIVISALNT